MPELAAMLLAAGGSRRLGQSKQLLSCHGAPLVMRAAKQLLEFCPRPVVVTGADAEAVETALRDLPVRVARNSNWQAGMGASIAAGVAMLDPDAAAVLILLCDQYRVSVLDLQHLTDCWHESPADICAAGWSELSGPPVIFPRRFFVDLLALDAATGARSLLEKYPGQVQRVMLPSAAHDLDQPADLEQMRAWEKAKD